MHLRPFVRSWACWSENEVCSGALLACCYIEASPLNRLRHHQVLVGQWRSIFFLLFKEHVSNIKVSLRQVNVTRRPSLKRLSGIQVQLLSLCMGKLQILQNCSLSLRLNFIFEIPNEIGQQLCHKCCFFCSNCVIKSLFLRLDQPVSMRSPERVSQSADCFYSNRDF